MRYLHSLCNGAMPMRCLSFDQTPLWFNNTALDPAYSVEGYEIEAHSTVHGHRRQRFSVCSFVDSAPPSNPANPPPVGVLFKATPNGKIWRELHDDADIPEWMHIQTQVKGSYRAEDMVQLLAKTLPPVVHDCDSTVVCLDWYAAHRDPRVAEGSGANRSVQCYWQRCGDRFF